jgi:hypothetical protein
MRRTALAPASTFGPGLLTVACLLAGCQERGSVCFTLHEDYQDVAECGPVEVCFDPPSLTEDGETVWTCEAEEGWPCNGEQPIKRLSYDTPDFDVQFDLVFSDGPTDLDAGALYDSLSDYMLKYTIKGLDDTGHEYYTTTFFGGSEVEDVESLENEDGRFRAVVGHPFRSLFTQVNVPGSCGAEQDSGSCTCWYQGPETNLSLDISADVYVGR